MFWRAVRRKGTGETGASFHPSENPRTENTKPKRAPEWEPEEKDQIGTEKRTQQGSSGDACVSLWEASSPCAAYPEYSMRMPQEEDSDATSTTTRKIHREAMQAGSLSSPLLLSPRRRERAAEEEGVVEEKWWSQPLGHTTIDTRHQRTGTREATPGPAAGRGTPLCSSVLFSSPSSSFFSPLPTNTSGMAAGPLSSPCFASLEHFCLLWNTGEGEETPEKEREDTIKRVTTSSSSSSHGAAACLPPCAPPPTSSGTSCSFFASRNLCHAEVDVGPCGAPSPYLHLPVVDSLSRFYSLFLPAEASMMAKPSSKEAAAKEEKEEPHEKAREEKILQRVQGSMGCCLMCLWWRLERQSHSTAPVFPVLGEEAPRQRSEKERLLFQMKKEEGKGKRKKGEARRKKDVSFTRTTTTTSTPSHSCTTDPGWMGPTSIPRMQLTTAVWDLHHVSTLLHTSVVSPLLEGMKKWTSLNNHKKDGVNPPTPLEREGEERSDKKRPCDHSIAGVKEDHERHEAATMRYPRERSGDDISSCSSTPISPSVSWSVSPAWRKTSSSTCDPDRISQWLSLWRWYDQQVTRLEDVLVAIAISAMRLVPEDFMSQSTMKNTNETPPPQEEEEKSTRKWRRGPHVTEEADEEDTKNASGSDMSEEEEDDNGRRHRREKRTTYDSGLSMHAFSRHRGEKHSKAERDTLKMGNRGDSHRVQPCRTSTDSRAREEEEEQARDWEEMSVEKTQKAKTRKHLERSERRIRRHEVRHHHRHYHPPRHSHRCTEHSHRRSHGETRERRETENKEKRSPREDASERTQDGVVTTRGNRSSCGCSCFCPGGSVNAEQLSVFRCVLPPPLASSSSGISSSTRNHVTPPSSTEWESYVTVKETNAGAREEQKEAVHDTPHGIPLPGELILFPVMVFPCSGLPITRWRAVSPPPKPAPLAFSSLVSSPSSFTSCWKEAPPLLSSPSLSFSTSSSLSSSFSSSIASTRRRAKREKKRRWKRKHYERDSSSPSSSSSLNALTSFHPSTRSRKDPRRRRGREERGVKTRASTAWVPSHRKEEAKRRSSPSSQSIFHSVTKMTSTAKSQDKEAQRAPSSVRLDGWTSTEWAAWWRTWRKVVHEWCHLVYVVLHQRDQCRLRCASLLQALQSKKDERVAPTWRNGNEQVREGKEGMGGGIIEKGSSSFSSSDPFGVCSPSSSGVSLSCSSASAFAEQLCTQIWEDLSTYLGKARGNDPETIWWTERETQSDETTQKERKYLECLPSAQRYQRLMATFGKHSPETFCPAPLVTTTAPSPNAMEQTKRTAVPSPHSTVSLRAHQRDVESSSFAVATFRTSVSGVEWENVEKKHQNEVAASQKWPTNNEELEIMEKRREKKEHRRDAASPCRFCDDSINRERHGVEEDEMKPKSRYSSSFFFSSITFLQERLLLELDMLETFLHLRPLRIQSSSSTTAALPSLASLSRGRWGGFDGEESMYDISTRTVLQLLELFLLLLEEAPPCCSSFGAPPVAFSSHPREHYHEEDSHYASDPYHGEHRSARGAKAWESGRREVEPTKECEKKRDLHKETPWWRSAWLSITLRCIHRVLSAFVPTRPSPSLLSVKKTSPLPLPFCINSDKEDSCFTPSIKKDATRQERVLALCALLRMPRRALLPHSDAFTAPHHLNPHAWTFSAEEKGVSMGVSSSGLTSMSSSSRTCRDREDSSRSEEEEEGAAGAPHRRCTPSVFLRRPHQRTQKRHHSKGIHRKHPLPPHHHHQITARFPPLTPPEASSSTIGFAVLQGLWSLFLPFISPPGSSTASTVLGRTAFIEPMTPSCYPSGSFLFSFRLLPLSTTSSALLCYRVYDVLGLLFGVNNEEKEEHLTETDEEAEDSLHHSGRRRTATAAVTVPQWRKHHQLFSSSTWLTFTCLSLLSSPTFPERCESSNDEELLSLSPTSSPCDAPVLYLAHGLAILSRLFSHSLLTETLIPFIWQTIGGRLSAASNTTTTIPPVGYGQRNTSSASLPKREQEMASASSSGWGVGDKGPPIPDTVGHPCPPSTGWTPFFEWTSSGWKLDEIQERHVMGTQTGAEVSCRLPSSEGITWRVLALVHRLITFAEDLLSSLRETIPTTTHQKRNVHRHHRRWRQRDGHRSKRRRGRCPWNKKARGRRYSMDSMETFSSSLRSLREKEVTYKKKRAGAGAGAGADTDEEGNVWDTHNQVHDAEEAAFVFTIEEEESETSLSTPTTRGKNKQRKGRSSIAKTRRSHVAFPLPSIQTHPKNRTAHHEHPEEGEEGGEGFFSFSPPLHLVYYRSCLLECIQGLTHSMQPILEACVHQLYERLRLVSQDTTTTLSSGGNGEETNTLPSQDGSTRLLPSHEDASERGATVRRNTGSAHREEEVPHDGNRMISSSPHVLLHAFLSRVMSVLNRLVVVQRHGQVILHRGGRLSSPAASSKATPSPTPSSPPIPDTERAEEEEEETSSFSSSCSSVESSITLPLPDDPLQRPSRLSLTILVDVSLLLYLKAPHFPFSIATSSDVSPASTEWFSSWTYWGSLFIGTFFREVFDQQVRRELARTSSEHGSTGGWAVGGGFLTNASWMSQRSRSIPPTRRLRDGAWNTSGPDGEIDALQRTTTTKERFSSFSAPPGGEIGIRTESVTALNRLLYYVLDGYPIWNRQLPPLFTFLEHCFQVFGKKGVAHGRKKQHQHQKKREDDFGRWERRAAAPPLGQKRRRDQDGNSHAPRRAPLPRRDREREEEEERYNSTPFSLSPRHFLVKQEDGFRFLSLLFSSSFFSDTYDTSFEWEGLVHPSLFPSLQLMTCASQHTLWWLHQQRIEEVKRWSHFHDSVALDSPEEVSSSVVSPGTFGVSLYLLWISLFRSTTTPPKHSSRSYCKVEGGTLRPPLSILDTGLTMPQVRHSHDVFEDYAILLLEQTLELWVQQQTWTAILWTWREKWRRGLTSAENRSILTGTTLETRMGTFVPPEREEVAITSFLEMCQRRYGYYQAFCLLTATTTVMVKTIGAPSSWVSVLFSLLPHTEVFDPRGRDEYPTTSTIGRRLTATPPKRRTTAVVPPPPEDLHPFSGSAASTTSFSTPVLPIWCISPRMQNRKPSSFSSSLCSSSPLDRSFISGSASLMLFWCDTLLTPHVLHAWVRKWHPPKRNPTRENERDEEEEETEGEDGHSLAEQYHGGSPSTSPPLFLWCLAGGLLYEYFDAYARTFWMECQPPCHAMEKKRSVTSATREEGRAEVFSSMKYLFQPYAGHDADASGVAARRARWRRVHQRRGREHHGVSSPLKHRRSFYAFREPRSWWKAEKSKKPKKTCCPAFSLFYGASIRSFFPSCTPAFTCLFSTWSSGSASQTRRKPHGSSAPYPETWPCHSSRTTAKEETIFMGQVEVCTALLHLAAGLWCWCETYLEAGLKEEHMERPFSGWGPCTPCSSSWRGWRGGRHEARDGDEHDTAQKKKEEITPTPVSSPCSGAHDDRDTTATPVGLQGRWRDAAMYRAWMNLLFCAQPFSWKDVSLFNAHEMDHCGLASASAAKNSFPPSPKVKHEKKQRKRSERNTATPGFPQEEPKRKGLRGSKPPQTENDAAARWKEACATSPTFTGVLNWLLSWSRDLFIYFETHTHTRRTTSSPVHPSHDESSRVEDCTGDLTKISKRKTPEQRCLPLRTRKDINVALQIADLQEARAMVLGCLWSAVQAPMRLEEMEGDHEAILPEIAMGSLSSSSFSLAYPSFLLRWMIGVRHVGDLWKTEFFFPSEQQQQHKKREGTQKKSIRNSSSSSSGSSLDVFSSSEDVSISCDTETDVTRTTRRFSRPTAKEEDAQPSTRFIREREEIKDHFYRDHHEEKTEKGWKKGSRPSPLCASPARAAAQRGRLAFMWIREQFLSFLRHSSKASIPFTSSSFLPVGTTAFSSSLEPHENWRRSEKEELSPEETCSSSSSSDPSDTRSTLCSSSSSSWGSDNVSDSPFLLSSHPTMPVPATTSVKKKAPHPATLFLSTSSSTLFLRLMQQMELSSSVLCEWMYMALHYLAALPSPNTVDTPREHPLESRNGTEEIEEERKKEEEEQQLRVLQEGLMWCRVLWYSCWSYAMLREVEVIHMSSSSSSLLMQAPSSPERERREGGTASSRVWWCLPLLPSLEAIVAAKLRTKRKSNRRTHPAEENHQQRTTKRHARNQERASTTSSSSSSSFSRSSTVSSHEGTRPTYRRDRSFSSSSSWTSSLESPVEEIEDASDTPVDERPAVQGKKEKRTSRPKQRSTSYRKDSRNSSLTPSLSPSWSFNTFFSSASFSSFPEDTREKNTEEEEEEEEVLVGILHVGEKRLCEILAFTCRYVLLYTTATLSTNTSSATPWFPRAVTREAVRFIQWWKELWRQFSVPSSGGGGVRWVAEGPKEDHHPSRCTMQRRDGRRSVLQDVKEDSEDFFLHGEFQNTKPPSEMIPNTETSEPQKAGEASTGVGPQWSTTNGPFPPSSLPPQQRIRYNGCLSLEALFVGLLFSADASNTSLSPTFPPPVAEEESTPEEGPQKEMGQDGITIENGSSAPHHPPNKRVEPCCSSSFLSSSGARHPFSLPGETLWKTESAAWCSAWATHFYLLLTWVSSHCMDPSSASLWGDEKKDKGEIMREEDNDVPAVASSSSLVFHRFLRYLLQYTPPSLLSTRKGFPSRTRNYHPTENRQEDEACSLFSSTSTSSSSFEVGPMDQTARVERKAEGNPPGREEEKRSSEVSFSSSSPSSTSFFVLESTWKQLLAAEALEESMEWRRRYRCCEEHDQHFSTIPAFLVSHSPCKKAVKDDDGGEHGTTMASSSWLSFSVMWRSIPAQLIRLSAIPSGGEPKVASSSVDVDSFALPIWWQLWTGIWWTHVQDMHAWSIEQEEEDMELVEEEEEEMTGTGRTSSLSFHRDRAQRRKREAPSKPRSNFTTCTDANTEATPFLYPPTLSPSLSFSSSQFSSCASFPFSSSSSFPKEEEEEEAGEEASPKGEAREKNAEPTRQDSLRWKEPREATLVEEEAHGRPLCKTWPCGEVRSPVPRPLAAAGPPMSSSSQSAARNTCSASWRTISIASTTGTTTTMERVPLSPSSLPCGIRDENHKVDAPPFFFPLSTTGATTRATYPSPSLAVGVEQLLLWWWSRWIAQTTRYLLQDLFSTDGELLTNTTPSYSSPFYLAGEAEWRRRGTEDSHEKGIPVDVDSSTAPALASDPPVRSTRGLWCSRPTSRRSWEEGKDLLPETLRSISPAVYWSDVLQHSLRVPETTCHTSPVLSKTTNTITSWNWTTISVLTAVANLFSTSPSSVGYRKRPRQPWRTSIPSKRRRETIIPSLFFPSSTALHAGVGKWHHVGITTGAGGLARSRAGKDLRRYSLSMAVLQTMMGVTRISIFSGTASSSSWWWWHHEGPFGVPKEKEEVNYQRKPWYSTDAKCHTTTPMTAPPLSLSHTQGWESRKGAWQRAPPPERRKRLDPQTKWASPLRDSSSSLEIRRGDGSGGGGAFSTWPFHPISSGACGGVVSPSFSWLKWVLEEIQTFYPLGQSLVVATGASVMKCHPNASQKDSFPWHENRGLNRDTTGDTCSTSASSSILSSFSPFSIACSGTSLMQLHLWCGLELQRTQRSAREVVGEVKSSSCFSLPWHWGRLEITLQSELMRFKREILPLWLSSPRTSSSKDAEGTMQKEWETKQSSASSWERQPLSSWNSSDSTCASVKRDLPTTPHAASLLFPSSLASSSVKGKKEMWRKAWEEGFYRLSILLTTLRLLRLRRRQVKSHGGWDQSGEKNSGHEEAIAVHHGAWWPTSFAATTLVSRIGDTFSFLHQLYQLAVLRRSPGGASCSLWKERSGVFDESSSSSSSTSSVSADDEPETPNEEPHPPPVEEEEEAPMLHVSPCRTDESTPRSIPMAETMKIEKDQEEEEEEEEEFCARYWHSLAEVLETFFTEELWIDEDEEDPMTLAHHEGAMWDHMWQTWVQPSTSLFSSVNAAPWRTPPIPRHAEVAPHGVHPSPSPLRFSSFSFRIYSFGTTAVSMSSCSFMMPAWQYATSCARWSVPPISSAYRLEAWTPVTLEKGGDPSGCRRTRTPTNEVFSSSSSLLPPRFGVGRHPVHGMLHEGAPDRVERRLQMFRRGAQEGSLWWLWWSSSLMVSSFSSTAAERKASPLPLWSPPLVLYTTELFPFSLFSVCLQELLVLLLSSSSSMMNGSSLKFEEEEKEEGAYSTGFSSRQRERRKRRGWNRGWNRGTGAVEEERERTLLACYRAGVLGHRMVQLTHALQWMIHAPSPPPLPFCVSPHDELENRRKTFLPDQTALDARQLAGKEQLHLLCERQSLTVLHFTTLQMKRWKEMQRNRKWSPPPVLASRFSSFSSSTFVEEEETFNVAEACRDGPEPPSPTTRTMMEESRRPPISSFLSPPLSEPTKSRWTRVAQEWCVKWTHETVIACGLFSLLSLRSLIASASPAVGSFGRCGPTTKTQTRRRSENEPHQRGPSTASSSLEEMKVCWDSVRMPLDSMMDLLLEFVDALGSTPPSAPPHTTMATDVPNANKKENRPAYFAREEIATGGWQGAPSSANGMSSPSEPRTTPEAPVQQAVDQWYDQVGGIMAAHHGSMPFGHRKWRTANGAEYSTDEAVRHEQERWLLWRLSLLSRKMRVVVWMVYQQRGMALQHLQAVLPEGMKLIFSAFG